MSEIKGTPVKKRLEFPVYLHKRVSILLLKGLHNSIGDKSFKLKEDKKIMDILADYYGKQRPFNVFDNNDF